MNPNLAGVSIVLVCSSILMAIVANLLDRKREDGGIGYERAQSMKVVELQLATILILLYSAIAFSQDLALEWLAAIALLCCFAASLLRRLLGILMDRWLAKEGELGGVPASEDALPATDEPPRLVAGHMAEMATDIIVWVSAIDLLLLFAMAFVEKVIPYYVGLAMG